MSSRRRIFTVQGAQFEVDVKYNITKPVGYGAYGVVVAANNVESGDKVAIKKIPKVFNDLVDGKRILREIKLLNHLKHENLISIKDILRPPHYETFEDIYIVSELMDTDLHQVIRSRQKLTEEHFQYFVYQLCRGLKYIHSANVLHRDLKPSNLLVNGNCDLKICDFGLARGIGEENKAMTEYVVTRWYRAPELLLMSHEYTKAIDIWSVGCILAELINRKPLFPGRDYLHQLNLITDAMGVPADEETGHIKSDEALKYLRSLPRKEKTPLPMLLPSASRNAIDFIEQCLTFNPARRPTAEQLLAHPFLASLHDPTDEPVAASPFHFDFDNLEVTERQLRDMLWAEALLFHPHD